jgi:hypothetical protein
MVDKRGQDNGEGAPEAKRPRTDGASKAPAGVNLEAIKKAKELLQKQKALQEKLKKLPQVRLRTACMRSKLAFLHSSSCWTH